MPGPLTHPKKELPEEVKHMYASERLMNFRKIAKILASRSPRVLTPEDHAALSLQEEISDIGEFAELVYGLVDVPKSAPPEFVLHNLDILNGADFPLEGYTQLTSEKVKPFCSFLGTTAGVPGFIAYRVQQKQLVTAICGTANIRQAAMDLQILSHRPKGFPPGCHVHTGFWRMYKGMRETASNGLKKSMQEFPDVRDFVITGHSLGGAIAFLFTLDLMKREDFLPEGSQLKIVTFGAPRCGNQSLVDHWAETVRHFQEKHGRSSFIDYAVKAYNDGVAALPPLQLGYRHFTQEPLYSFRGKLYHIPATEREHTFFYVEDKDVDDKEEVSPAHFWSRGGHNYYSGRQLERFRRRLGWFHRARQDFDSEEKQKEMYLAHVKRKERPWLGNSGKVGLKSESEYK